jgi:hypothetical protein
VWYAASEKEARVSCGVFLHGRRAASGGKAIADRARRTAVGLRFFRWTLGGFHCGVKSPHLNIVEARLVAPPPVIELDRPRRGVVRNPHRRVAKRARQAWL